MTMTKEQFDSDAAVARMVIKVIVGAVVFVILVIWGWKWVTPKYNLYRAETEKQAVIAEQKAISEAAEFAAKSEVIQAQAKADAEIIRSRGLAESQEIITETLTEDYIRYLYIQAIEGNSNQIIYVPTEGGLPILEANRLNTGGGE